MWREYAAHLLVGALELLAHRACLEDLVRVLLLELVDGDWHLLEQREDQVVVALALLRGKQGVLLLEVDHREFVLGLGHAHVEVLLSAELLDPRSLTGA